VPGDDSLTACLSCGTIHAADDRCDDGRGRPLTADDQAAEEQRQAKERERSFFLRPASLTEEAERATLRAGRYPRRSVNHVPPAPPVSSVVIPAARRTPARATPRPAVRTTSRATRTSRGDPDDLDPPPPRGVALAPDNLSAPAPRAWLDLHGEAVRGG